MRPRMAATKQDGTPSSVPEVQECELGSTAKTKGAGGLASAMKIRMGEVLRYGRPYASSPPVIDGFRNYFYVTGTPGLPLALLERGISPISRVKATDGDRIPAILIRSSPHKIGSDVTPWQDHFDPDNGHIRYFGDSKHPGQDPALAPGNKVMLEAARTHGSLDAGVRKRAMPILFFRTVPRGGAAKGYV